MVSNSCRLCCISSNSSHDGVQWTTEFYRGCRHSSSIPREVNIYNNCQMLGVVSSLKIRYSTNFIFLHSTYKLLCLALGHLERLLEPTLLAAVELVGGLSPRQKHSFRNGHSTLTSINVECPSTLVWMTSNWGDQSHQPNHNSYVAMIGAGRDCRTQKQNISCVTQGSSQTTTDHYKKHSPDVSFSGQVS